MANAKEKKEKAEAASPMDKLLRAQKEHLIKIEGDKALKNFAEALKLIGRLDKIVNFGIDNFSRGEKRIKIGNHVIDVLKEIQAMAEAGRNQEAAERLRERMANIVKAGLKSGEIRVEDSLMMLGEYETKNLMQELVPSLKEVNFDILGSRHQAVTFALFSSWVEAFNREGVEDSIKSLSKKIKELRVKVPESGGGGHDEFAGALYDFVERRVSWDKIKHFEDVLEEAALMGG
jgi:hypothetical protein